VKINSRILNGVRVKGIKDYVEIGKIQQYYKDEGYEFVKNEKGYTRVRCLIPKNTIKF
jgi:hypothetical protein